MARRRNYKRDRIGRFAKTAGAGSKARSSKPTFGAQRAGRRLADRKKYDRIELRYNKAAARSANPKRDLSSFDYMSKSQRTKFENKNATLAKRAKQTRGSRGPLISRKAAAGAAGALGVAGVVFGANAVVVSRGITAAHTRALFKL